jgi:beta-lactamase regulating signal transducer with metallopeptidase domain
MTVLGVPILATAALLAAKGAFLLAAAWTAALLIKRPGPIVRRWIWFSALAGLLLLPLTSPLLPKVSLPVFESVASASGSEPGPAPAAAAADSAPVGKRPSSGLPAWVATAYFLGATVSLAWMIQGRRKSSGMRRRARRLTASEVRGLLDGLGIRRATEPIRIGISEAESGPSVAGLIHPSVLLPAGFREWPRERLRAAILHEAAHIRHRDLPARAAGAAACLLHWFNPLAWIALRRMIREQESACDLFVIGQGLRPSRYAADVLSFARPAGRIPEFGPAGISGARDLLYRLERILDPKPPNVGTGRFSGLGFAAGIALVLLTAAFMPWEDPGRLAALRAEGAEFLFTGVSPHHQALLAEADDALYLERLSVELETARFNKSDFEAHLARMRDIEDRAPADPNPLRESVRTGRRALLDKYMPVVEKYSRVRDDLMMEKRAASTS